MWIFSNRYSISESENAESIQVLHYEFGQKYDALFYYFHDKINRVIIIKLPLCLCA
uniref:Uncharacterized protein n=1 Tax=Arundo donax TaxID=35708 RepID=A0A0A9CZY5_ARUDO